jgi:PAS domain S-box-containing protein
MDEKFLFVNRAMGETLGYEPEQLHGKNFNHFSHPQDREIGKKEIRNLLDKNEAYVTFEKRYIHQNGKYIWVDITLALLRDENDKPIHFIAQIQDITIRKEANEAIDKHRRALQLFIEYAPAAIAMFNKDMEFMSASHRFNSDFGLKDKNLVGKSYYKVFPEIPERWKQTHKRCLAGTTESCEEDSFLRKNGKLDWIRWEIHPWYESNNEIGGIILFSEVITEKKKAEERINAQVKRLKSLRAIDMAIINSFDVTTMLNVLLDSLILTLEVDAADVMLIDPITNTLVTEVHKGFISSRTMIEKIPLDKILAGKSFLSRKTAIIPNIKDDTEEITRNWLVTEENFISYIGIPLVAKGQIKGILEVFHRSILKPDIEWMEFLESLAGQAAIAVDNSQIYENMRRINLNLSLAYEETIESWASALDLRDKETPGHTQYLADLTTELCKAMAMNEKEITHARRGALLHDVGKIIIPDEILFKPGPLSNEEWDIIRKHPEYAYEILSSIEYLSPALEIPYNHHERWNGSGYPRGLKERQIPLSARIFSVIDVWDALTSPRPFRAAWLEEDASKYIEQEAGKLFDPEVVKHFFKIIQT